MGTRLPPQDLNHRRGAFGPCEARSEDIVTYPGFQPGNTANKANRPRRATGDACFRSEVYSLPPPAVPSSRHGTKWLCLLLKTTPGHDRHGHGRVKGTSLFAFFLRRRHRFMMLIHGLNVKMPILKFLNCVCFGGFGLQACQGALLRNERIFVKQNEISKSNFRKWITFARQITDTKQCYWL